MTGPQNTLPNADLSADIARWKGQLPDRVELARAFQASSAGLAEKKLRQWNASGLADGAIPASQRVQISLCGFGTLNYLAPFVRWAALAEGFVPKLTVGSYNQLFQDLACPDSEAIQADTDIVWIWLDLADIVPEPLWQTPRALLAPQSRLVVEQAVHNLVEALVSARARTKALFLINEFVPMRRSPLGIADGAAGQGFAALHRVANDCLQQAVLRMGSACVFPLGHFLMRFGLERACDPRLRLLADCRFSPDFHFQAAHGLGPYIRSIKGTMRKVLVLDLDNTLWGGVVGEDGWDGVRIGEGDPVSKAFAAFQKAILELYDRGVILAINSKNNWTDVQELFACREEMLLKLDHFASIQVNWQDKATNCRTIAQEINVGVDSLVFWDDNPQERALVRELLPEVLVVEVPSDPSRRAGQLMDLDVFDSLVLTEEDSTRGRMYVEDRLRREAAVTAPDLGSFLESLGLKVGVARAADGNVARLASLLARTNQFNLTTQRHTEQDLRRWAADADWSVLGFSAEDRFGSYGIVGLTILRKRPAWAEIDSLLLSCRAMGKGIEDCMLAAAARQACQWGLHQVRARYIPTKKNMPARDFLPSHGFVELARGPDGAEYTIRLEGDRLAMPSHVTVEFPV